MWHCNQNAGHASQCQNIPSIIEQSHAMPNSAASCQPIHKIAVQSYVQCFVVKELNSMWQIPPILATATKRRRPILQRIQQSLDCRMCHRHCLSARLCLWVTSPDQTPKGGTKQVMISQPEQEVCSSVLYCVLWDKRGI